MKLEFKNEDSGDEPFGGTSALFDIYERCNVTIIDLVRYEEAATYKRWMAASLIANDLVFHDKTKALQVETLFPTRGMIGLICAM